MFGFGVLILLMDFLVSPLGCCWIPLLLTSRSLMWFGGLRYQKIKFFTLQVLLSYVNTMDRLARKLASLMCLFWKAKEDLDHLLGAISL